MADVYTIDLSGAVLAYLVRFHDQHDREHSLQFTMEDALVQGLKAKFRSIEYGEDVKRRKAFTTELQQHPEFALDAAKMQQLMRKYRIGSSNGKSAAQAAPPTLVEVEPTLTEAELEQATAPAA